MRSLFFYFCLIISIASQASNDSLGLLEKARTQIDEQQFEQALMNLDSLIELHPQFDSAYLERGYLHLNLWNYKSAIQDFTSAIGLNENLFICYYLRGIAYAELFEYDSASSDLTVSLLFGDPEYKTYSLKARAEVYDSQHKFHLALADLKMLYSIDSSATALSNIGLMYNRMERNREAAVYHDRAIQADSSIAHSWYLRSINYTDLNDLDSALQDIEQAVRLDSCNALFYEHKASVLTQLKRYPEALKVWDIAIDLDPMNPFSYYSRGKLKQDFLGDKKGARMDLQKAKELGFN